MIGILGQENDRFLGVMTVYNAWAMLCKTEFKGSSQYSLITKDRKLYQEGSLPLKYVLQSLWMSMLNVQKQIVVLWIAISRGKYFHTADRIASSMVFNSLFISIFQWEKESLILECFSLPKNRCTCLGLYLNYAVHKDVWLRAIDFYLKRKSLCAGHKSNLTLWSVISTLDLKSCITISLEIWMQHIDFQSTYSQLAGSPGAYVWCDWWEAFRSEF